MSTPLHLVLVRHGQSEANVVQKRDKPGLDPHPLQESVYERVDSHQRLTSEGRSQAIAAGEWLMHQGLDPESFDERYVSPYVRTMETAGLLGGPDTLWLPEVRLIERDWGAYGATPAAQRAERFPDTERARAQSGFFARYDGGESISDVVSRFRDFLGTLARDFPDRRVIAVTHGELMWTARFVIERLLPEEWNELDDDESMRMGNCCVLEYTRVNPLDPDEVRSSLSRGWCRIVNTDRPTSPYGGGWRELHGKQHRSGAELLELADARVPLLGIDETASTTE